MAEIWTLSRIQQKIRQVTGRFTPAEISNDELRTRINQYYTLTFPAEVKLEQKHSYYQFTTDVNQPTYAQPETSYTNFEPPASCNNLSVTWYQDPSQFLTSNHLQYTFLTQWTGDGATTNFSSTVVGFPIYPGTTTVSDNVELFQDTTLVYTTADIAITGSAGGSMTLNYSTGSVNVTFNAAPADGQNIYLNYVVFQPGRPQAILMYNNQFQLWPVPDQQYIIKMKAYSIVTELTDATDTPDLSEWGPCIAYGTARDLLADYGEFDGYSEVTALYKEQVAYVLKRTNQDLLNTRAMPTF